jgi:hypothetical protein
MHESYQIRFFDKRRELIRQIINPSNDLGETVRQAAHADATAAEVEVVVLSDAGTRIIWRGTREGALTFVCPT